MPAYRDDDPSLLHLELEALPRGTAVGEVARALTERLTAGNLAPGSRLPPERALAQDLGVGRSAVREALAALEILGIVEVRPGSGTYLRSSTSELLPTTLSWGLMLSASKTAELSEVRSGLERQAAAAAAERATPEELTRIAAHLEDMRASVDTIEEFIAADARFHLQIAESARNEVLRDLLVSVRSMLRLWVERGLRDRSQALDAVAEHEAVLAALLTRDPIAAEDAMNAHMRTASRRLADADPAP